MTDHDTDEWFYARKLLRNIISRGLYISADNGEDELTDPSRDEDMLLARLNTTETDTLRLYRLNAGGLLPVGFFFLVWGNDPSGEELVSDHSANRLCYNIWGEVFGKEMVV